MEHLRIVRAQGAYLEQHLPALADLRIRVFREFPYLYEGSADYEQRYLRKYAESPDSLVTLVYDGDRVVGASSALPLADEAPELQKPFRENGFDVSSVFYCGESVLLPEYRGRGLGVRFFAERESHARSLGRFEQIAFCAVERPGNHPRRPIQYRPLDDFWLRRGYAKRPELRAHYVWKDLDETEASPKPMVFWMKTLG